MRGSTLNDDIIRKPESPIARFSGSRTIIQSTTELDSRLCPDGWAAMEVLFG